MMDVKFETRDRIDVNELQRACKSERCHGGVMTGGNLPRKLMANRCSR